MPASVVRDFEEHLRYRSGAAADYGHGDLAIDRFADQDVFEPVHEFLAAERLEIRERHDDEPSQSGRPRTDAPGGELF